MKKVRNRQVVDRWYGGAAATNHTSSLTTDGTKLRSYNLCIGDTHPSGVKVLRDYTANGNHGFKSQTTSCHVGLARAVADLVD